jgi:predicted nucleotidyltransferase
MTFLSPLGTKAGLAILSRTHLAPNQEFYLRELVRATGMAPRTIQRELDRLVAAGILAERRHGNRRYLRAGIGHPLYAPLRDIVMKTAGIVPLLRSTLGKDGIELAFVFGSVATGTADARSDIDLFVVATIGLREVVRRLSPAQQQFGREISPVVWSPEEFRTRRRDHDQFLARVLANQRLMVVGDDDDLARLGD